MEQNASSTASDFMAIASRCIGCVCCMQTNQLFILIVGEQYTFGKMF
ncbi:unnamed protein product, partial [Heterotrigona itama]